MTASKLKKTSLTDLQAMVDAQKPKARKPRELPDRVMVEAGKPEDVRATKAGSKRHLMAEALAKGATVEELMALLNWNKDTVTSAFRTDMRALGFGVERKAGKYFLLFPKKIKRLSSAIVKDVASTEGASGSVNAARSEARFVASVTIIEVEMPQWLVAMVAVDPESVAVICIMSPSGG